MVLLGVEQEDTEKDGAYLAEKLAGLRIFEDDHEKMNLSVQQVGGSILLVSPVHPAGGCTPRQTAFLHPGGAAPGGGRSV
jgi:D-aminoacyl-tRNA deacylase